MTLRALCLLGAALAAAPACVRADGPAPWGAPLCRGGGDAVALRVERAA